VAAGTATAGGLPIDADVVRVRLVLLLCCALVGASFGEAEEAEGEAVGGSL